MRKTHCYFLSILAVGLFLSWQIGESLAETTVEGAISSDTTWTMAGSPYIVTANALVGSGVTLTIEPGVTVKFGSGTAMHVNGTFVARGTEGAKILFTSNNAVPAPGNWGYIYFSDSSIDAVYDGGGNYMAGSIIEYAIVEYGGGALVNNNNGTLRMENAHPFISHSEIRNNAITGITGWLLSGDLRIVNNNIHDNGSTTYNGGGIWVDDWSKGVALLIEGNTIRSNVGSYGGGIYANVYKNSVIRNNIIDGNSAASWGAGIYFYGTGTIDGNVISNNTSPNYGAGMFILWSTVSVSNNLIVNNKSQGVNNRGGGIFIETTHDGVVDIGGNVIADNEAGLEGGGVYVLPGYNIGTWIAIHDNSFIRNSAGTSPAGVFSDSPRAFSYNTFTGNRATNSSATSAVTINHTPLFNFNNIFNNTTTYALYNNNPQTYANINGTGNWWGSAVNADIMTQIYDWFDDSAKGLVNYSPAATAIRTDAPISPPTGLAINAETEGQAALRWTANSESDTAGYKVYWGTKTGFPYANAVDVGNTASYTIEGLTGETIYVTVTAYDTAASMADDPDTFVNENQVTGHESWYAAELTSTSCTYTLYPTGSQVSAAGNTGTVAITTSSSSCLWTATSNNSWMTITSGSSGSGSANVGYSFASNNGLPRTGTITIGDQTFTITQASPNAHLETVQRVYIGYYQRPADPAGLIYWAGRLNASSGNLSEIIDAFADSQESQALYGTINGSSISTVINDIYRGLLNRDADQGGRDYYVDGFNDGRFTAATIMLNILYGAASGDDLLSVNNKITGANLFTMTIDPDLDGGNFQVTYAGDGDVIAARNFLSLYATSIKIPTQTETTAYIKTNIANSGDGILRQ